MSADRDDIPQKVGRYTIEQALGFGAMGAVYKGFDPLINRTVAIKTLRLDGPPQSSQYRSFLARFRTEAQISGTLSHPNIVTLFDIGETEDGVPFLAMEFVEGETVAEILESGKPLQPEEVVGLVSQMASAIDYAHQKGVIHRDIKPSNIIIHDRDKVKITDFGIAKLMDAEVTQDGSLLGTPSYMSPEQAMGETLDGRTDIFSLGVVAFELLSGKQPFPGNNVTSVLYKLVHADPVKLDNLQVLGLVPDRWHRVFSRALAKDPVDRYDTAASFVSELEQCLGSWFGAVEGETVVMSFETTPDSEAPGTSDGPAEGQGQPGSEDAEKTVLFSRAQERTSTRPEQPGRDDGAETVLLPTPLEAGTGEEATKVIVPAELEETRTRRGPALDEEDTRTVRQRSLREAETVWQPQDATRVPASDSTRPVSTPNHGPSAGVETATLPRGSRGKKWGRKHLLFVGGATGVLLFGLLASLLLVGGREEPPVTPEVMRPRMPRPVMGPPAPVRGALAVQSDPEGATVWVNGEERGLTPRELADLDLGAYTVRLEKRGFRAEELTAVLSSESPSATLNVSLRRAAAPRPRAAFLRIRSSPAGALVEVDGRPAGETPLDRFRVRPGKRTIRIDKAGFQSWEQTVSVAAGASEVVSVTLEALEEGRPTPPVGELPPVEKTQVGALVEPGPGVVSPRCIECPPVPYPDLARRQRKEGVVLVSFIVTENGDVQDIRVVESEGGEVFESAVLRVLQSYKYEPATKHGVRVKMRKVQRFRFRRGR